MSSIAGRLRSIEEGIGAACARSGRQPSEVTLVGASKLQGVERLREAWEAGLRTFGENRVQEAAGKAAALPSEAQWHLLGPLQSNKVRLAVPLFSAFHAVDRVKIAEALSRETVRLGVTRDIFLEVNLGEEPTKHGFLPGELAAQAARIVALPGLRVLGLMAIPPFSEDPATARRWFRELRRLRDDLSPSPGWAVTPGRLSMGMSSDFEIAVEEGATHVRVGTSLFGDRALR